MTTKYLKTTVVAYLPVHEDHLEVAFGVSTFEAATKLQQEWFEEDAYLLVSTLQGEDLDVTVELVDTFPHRPPA